MPAVAQFSSGAVKGDVFYVAGGELPPSSAPVVVKSLWMYYVPTDNWVPGARALAAVASPPLAAPPWPHPG